MAKFKELINNEVYKRVSERDLATKYLQNRVEIQKRFNEIAHKYKFLLELLKENKIEYIYDFALDNPEKTDIDDEIDSISTAIKKSKKRFSIVYQKGVLTWYMLNRLMVWYENGLCFIEKHNIKDIDTIKARKYLKSLNHLKEDFDFMEKNV